MRTRLLVGALCAVPLAAQSPVSPSHRSTSPGNAASALPFGTQQPLRYLEIHSNLAPGQTFRGLSWRQNEGGGSFTGTRTLDLEVIAGRAVRADIIRFGFAANYIGAPTSAMARRIVNFGPQGAAGSPSPFQGMSLSFDAPFVFASGSLAWEARIYAATDNGVFAPADAEEYALAQSTDGTEGQGCNATGNLAPMRLDSTSLALGLGAYYALAVRVAPANAPLVVAFGANNPNLPVPGLCCNLFTDLTATLGLGSTAGDGSYLSSGAAVFAVQRDLGGQTLRAQAFALDVGSPNAIPLVGSNGAVTTFAAPGVFPDCSRIYALGAANAPVAPFAIDTLGVALVTRFDT